MRNIRQVNDLPHKHADYLVEKINHNKVYDFYFLRYGGYVVDYDKYKHSKLLCGIIANKDVLDVFKRFDYHNYSFFDVNINCYFCNGVIKYAYEQVKANKSKYKINKRYEKH